MLDDSAPSILVVDDNPDNIRIIGTFLRKDGYAIRVATSGATAIESAKLLPPDLILMDVSMPVMDGYETCRILHSIDALAHIPILFITAEKKDTQSSLEGFKAGGVDYIEKPVENVVLAARVRLHLGLLQARRSLEERNRELEKINGWNTRMLSILGHDLRNPISGFRGLTEILVHDLDDLDAPSLREYLLELHKAARNTEAILESILAWAAASRQDAADPATISLDSLMTELVEQIESMAMAKEIHLEAPGASDISVYADLEMTRTILRNIVSNAIKFTPQGGTVRIEYRTDSKTMAPEILVRDTGPGMPPEILSKLFTKEQKSTWGTAGEKGSGLGLLICHELAEKQGCSLWAESVVGKGSVFHVGFQHSSTPETQ